MKIVSSIVLLGLMSTMACSTEVMIEVVSCDDCSASEMKIAAAKKTFSQL